MSETNSESTGLIFNLKPMKAKPKRKYRKGSKYDPLIEAFNKGTNKLVSVVVDGKDANYLRTQLGKRIEAKPNIYKGITVAVVNNICYLEKTT